MYFLCTSFFQEKDAIDLVNEAIQAGIFNDLGSGGNVDICGMFWSFKIF